MRILIATPLYPPEIGGPATYARVLEEHLPGLGIDVDVLPFSAVRHLPKGISHIAYGIKVFRQGKSADVILAQDPMSVGVPASLAAFFLKKCFLLRIAGDFAWEQGVQRFGVTDSLDAFVKKDEDYHLLVRIFKKIQTMVAKRADGIVVPSEYMKKMVSAWGIPKKDISVIPNPVENVSEQGNRKTIRGVLKFNGKMLISVGRLVPWKGFDTLIELMPDLLKKHPDTKLVIVGSGPEYDKLDARIMELGLGDNVVLTGSLERDILLRYLKAADVFVLNTSFESFSFQVIEAQWVGIPIVTTRTGNLPEFLTHERNALLVKPNDKSALLKEIHRALTDKALTRNLVREGAKTATQFEAQTVSHMVQKHIERICGS